MRGKAVKLFTLTAAFLLEGFAVYAFGNCRVGFVSAYLDGFERTVMLGCKIILAGSNIAVDTWILGHGFILLVSDMVKPHLFCGTLILSAQLL